MLSSPKPVRFADRVCIGRAPARPWQVAAIEHVVAASFGLTPAALRTAGRGSAAVAHARQIAMYLARTRLEFSYATIGAAFGRDRTTVAHACRAIEELREQDAHDRLLADLESAIDPHRAACGRLVAGG